MRLRNLAAGSLFALLLAQAVSAQFVIRVDQDNQVFNVSNGGQLGFNARGVGATLSARISFTYISQGQVNFTSPPQIFGNGDFFLADVQASGSLGAQQTATVTILYTARTSSASFSQFSWPFEIPPPSTAPIGTASVPGLLALTLAGSAPSLVVSSIGSNGNYTPLVTPARIQFPDTLLTSASDIGISLANRGSGQGSINSIVVTGDGFQVQSLPLLPLPLGANTESRFQIRLQSGSVGPKTGTLQVIFGNGTAFQASLEGRILASPYTYEFIKDGVATPVSPGQSLVLPDTKVGERATAQLRFRNQATLPVSLTNLATSAQFALIDGPVLPALIQPGEQQSITIGYQPTLPGDIPGRLLVGSDSFDLKGRGLGPQLRYSTLTGTVEATLAPQDVISFPPVVVGQASKVRFTLTNTGTTTASVVSLGITEPSNGFSLEGLPALPSQIAPGGSTSFTIAFTPAASGQSLAGLVVDGRLFTLSGFSSGAVQYSYRTAVGDTPILPLGTVQFSPLTVGQTSTVTFVITNSASSKFTVASVGLVDQRGAFRLSGLPSLPTELAAGGTSTFNISFVPPTDGQFTAVLQIDGKSFALAGFSNPAAQYSYRSATGETPVIPTGTVQFSPLTVGQTASVTFVVTNTASSALRVASIGLLDQNGAFRLNGLPPLPTDIAAGGAMSFTVSFVPPGPSQFSAVLQIDDKVFALAGFATAPVQYSYRFATGETPVIPQGTVQFSPVAAGSSATAEFIVTNRGTTPVRVTSLGLVDEKEAFRLANLPTLPVEIPGGSSISFSIVFAPKQPGPVSAVLAVDSSLFSVVGFASDPPALPSYRFTGASGRQEPFKQPAIGLSLDAPYSLPLVGRLTLVVNPDNFVIDPAVRFSTGSREVAFTIPAGSREALFETQSTQIQLQTGTVAGTFVIEARFATESGVELTPASPVQLRMEVPRLAPTILSSRVGTRTPASLSIVVTGFATTRALQTLEFEFKGEDLSTAKLTVSVAAEAFVWYQSPTGLATGGQFSVDIPFALRADGTAIGTDLTSSVKSVNVTAINDLGRSNTVEVLIP